MMTWLYCKEHIHLMERGNEEEKNHLLYLIYHNSSLQTELYEYSDYISYRQKKHNYRTKEQIKPKK